LAPFVKKRWQKASRHCLVSAPIVCCRRRNRVAVFDCCAGLWATLICDRIELTVRPTCLQVSGSTWQTSPR
jgi:hypothetical protein